MQNYTSKWEHNGCMYSNKYDTATTNRQWKSNKLAIQLDQSYQKVRLTFFNQTINRLSCTASELTIPQAELGRHTPRYMYHCM